MKDQFQTKEATFDAVRGFMTDGDGLLCDTKLPGKRIKSYDIRGKPVCKPMWCYAHGLTPGQFQRFRAQAPTCLRYRL